jgi:hypothetical protein
MATEFLKNDRRKMLKKILAATLCAAVAAMLSAALYLSLPAKAIFAP